MSKKISADYTASDFRSPILVEVEVDTPDGSGGFVQSWIPSFSFFAYVRQSTSNESYGDKDKGRVLSQETIKVSTWYRDDILTIKRLIFNGRKFNVRSVNNVDYRNKFLDIIAEAGVEQ